MHDAKIDFTRFFRRLGQIKNDASLIKNVLRDEFLDCDLIDQCFEDYVNRLKIELISDEERQQSMNLVNSKYILRNYLAQRAIERAQNNNFSEITKLLRILSNPFDEQAEYESYSLPPPYDAPMIEVSCSS